MCANSVEGHLAHLQDDCADTGKAWPVLCCHTDRIIALSRVQTKLISALMRQMSPGLHILLHKVVQLRRHTWANRRMMWNTAR